MRGYQHRQTGYAFAITGLVVGIWLVVSAIALGGKVLVNVIVAAIIGLVVSAFTTLRTGVDRKTVHASFTFGLPRRNIPVKDIEEHGPVRNRWIYGWGVRLVPGGLLYAVWGLDAVAVTYRKGGRSKTLRIGTDDVEGLDAAITAARAERPATG